MRISDWSSDVCSSDLIKAQSCRSRMGDTRPPLIRKRISNGLPKQTNNPCGSKKECKRSLASAKRTNEASSSFDVVSERLASHLHVRSTSKEKHIAKRFINPDRSDYRKRTRLNSSHQ